MLNITIKYKFNIATLISIFDKIDVKKRNDIIINKVSSLTSIF